MMSNNESHTLGPVKRTDDELAVQLDSLLDETDGNKTVAAKALGVSIAVVNRLIEQIPALHVKWATRRDVPSVDRGTVDRKPITAPLVKPDPVALELANDDKRLDTAMRNMGFSKAEIETIMTMEDFAGRSFERTLTILHGGTVKSAMRLMMQADDIANTYLQDETLDMKEKKMWWELYFRLLENMRAQSEQAHKAALTRAIIKSKNSGDSGKGAGKPGFSTLIAIQNNHGDSKQEPKKVN